MVAIRAPELDSIPFKTASYPPVAGDFVLRAIKLAARGDAEGALRALDAALAGREDDPLLLEGKALLFLMLERPSDALIYLDAAVSSGGDNPTLYTARAVALYLMGRLNDSLAAFNRSIDLDPNETVLSMKRAVLEEILRNLVRQGFASWSGGKPSIPKHRIKLTPGPAISDYIIEERDRLRN